MVEKYPPSEDEPNTSAKPQRQKNEVSSSAPAKEQPQPSSSTASASRTRATAPKTTQSSSSQQSTTHQPPKEAQTNKLPPSAPALEFVVTTASIPLPIFTCALPSTSPTLALLETLPTTAPSPPTSVPTSLHGTHITFHRDIPTNSLIFTGSFPAASAQYVQTYLAVLAPIRSLRSKSDNSSLPGQYNSLFSDLLDSAGCNPGEKALVLMYLAIIARELGLEELQYIAEDGLAKVLTQAASLIHGWSEFDIETQDYWEGAVRWDEKRDLGVNCVVELMRAVMANEIAEDEDGEEAEFDHKKLCEGGRGTSNNAIYWNWDLTRERSQSWRRLNFQKGYLTELVYQFFAYRLAFLRYHPEVQQLLKEFPLLTYEIVMRYPPFPRPAMQGARDEDGDFMELTDADEWRLHSLEDVAKKLENKLCKDCKEKIDDLEQEAECVCGLSFFDAEDCENCRGWRDSEEEGDVEDGSETDDGKEDNESGSGEENQDEEEYLSEDELDSESLQDETALELKGLVADLEADNFLLFDPRKDILKQAKETIAKHEARATESMGENCTAGSVVEAGEGADADAPMEDAPLEDTEVEHEGLLPVGVKIEVVIKEEKK